MGIIKKHTKLVLLIIIIIQFTVIGIFAYNDNVSTIAPGNDIIAIVSVEDSVRLLVQRDDSHNLFEIPETARYINFKNKQVYLFDKEYQYIHTLVFDRNLSKYTIFDDGQIEYTDTKFECKRSICMLKQSQNDGASKVQIFTTNDFEYEFLAADNFHW